MKKRRVIDVEGLGHTNPIPAACSIGNLLVSGGIFGRDPATGELGVGIESQCSLMFGNVEHIMSAAGGSTDDIIKMTVWLKDVSNKQALNVEWSRMFPDARSRPARHTFSEPNMAHGQFIQCEIMAVLDDGRI